MPQSSARAYTHIGRRRDGCLRPFSEKAVQLTLIEEVMSIAKRADSLPEEAAMHANLGRLAESASTCRAREHYEQACLIYGQMQDVQKEAAIADRLGKLPAGSEGK